MYAAFMDFVQMGPTRMLRTCSEKFGHSLASIGNWSSIHNWFDRARDYDQHELDEAFKGREMERERVRQFFIDEGMDAAQTIKEVRQGRLEPPPCTCENPMQCMCGAWLPIMDRHGEVVGLKPAVAASTRQLAALAELDRAGLTVPKRVELTGADGKELLDARTQLAGLSQAKLDALAAVFSGDDE
jgi:hypothetical protein